MMISFRKTFPKIIKKMMSPKSNLMKMIRVRMKFNLLMREIVSTHHNKEGSLNIAKMCTPLRANQPSTVWVESNFKAKIILISLLHRLQFRMRVRHPLGFRGSKRVQEIQNKKSHWECLKPFNKTYYFSKDSKSQSFSQLNSWYIECSAFAFATILKNTLKRSTRIWELLNFRWKSFQRD